MIPMFQKIRTWILKILKPAQAHAGGLTKHMSFKTIEGNQAIVRILLQRTIESGLKVFSKNINKTVKSEVV